MKAIVNTGPNQLELLDYPLPAPAPGQVRIRTAACGICATELEVIKGWDRTGFPTVPGHEWAGVVDSVGAGVKQVVMIGGRTGRLALARDLGAAATFDFLQLGDALIPAIRQQVSADILRIIETSGTGGALSNALEFIGRGGQLILLGSYGT